MQSIRLHVFEKKACDVIFRTLVIVCAVFSAAFPSVSQPLLTQSDIDALDMTRIDEALNEIALQIDRLPPVGGSSTTELSSLSDTTSGATVPIPTTQRARANALCFGDSTLGLGTPEELDRYLADLEALIERVDTTLAAFDGLKAINPQGSCPTFMVEMIVTIDRRLGTFSRRDISDLVFHLETCWPDDGVTRQDATPVNMDQTHARARGGLVEYGRSQRGFREASTWCE